MPKLPSVLLVDDDPTNNFLNERLLKRLEVTERVLVAANGREALALLHQSHTAPEPAYPALILLDIKMPVMNGIEFLQAYEQLPLDQQRASTVVVLTTSMDAGDLARLEQLPAAGLVNKPLTQDKVDTLLRIHFARQPRA